MNANLLAVKDAYDATSRGDFDKLIGLLSPGIRWRVTGPGPLAGEYIGTYEVGGFFAEMGKVYGDSFRLRVLDTLASDEHVVVLTSEEGASRGERVAWRSAHVFKFRGARCVEFLSFQDDAFIDFWTARKEPAAG
jgi:ketosteroid isomerase-like protein